MFLKSSTASTIEGPICAIIGLKTVNRDNSSSARALTQPSVQSECLERRPSAENIQNLPGMPSAPRGIAPFCSKRTPLFRPNI